MDETCAFEIDALPEEAEVLRLLGHKPGSMEILDPMRRVLARARKEALGLTRARIAVRRIGVDAAACAGLPFRGARELVVGAATIGSALEDRAEALVAQREWTLALVLDAYGSAAVERAVVEANYRVCEEAEAEGLTAGRRVSPGYPRWPLEGQAALFGLLGGAPLGIHLNEHFVMTPRKSVTFGIPVGIDLDKGNPELGCRFCAMTHCAYRREPAAPEAGA